MIPLATGAALQSLHELPERTFESLDADARARLGIILRPLAWLDGLIAAVAVSPEEPEDWLEHIWVEEELGKLTLPQADAVAAVVWEQYSHVFDMLLEGPQAYRPFLAGATDALDAAVQWAAGFGFGIQLHPEAWAPLIDDEHAQPLLALVFCLEGDEDLPEAAKARSPFRDISAERREEMRRQAVAILPAAVCALHEISLNLQAAGLDAELGEQLVEDGLDEPPLDQQPYVRSTVKVGRNDPCPCGSGKKHKKCCLGP
ncbi:MAG: UPF0149 family protein [Hyphomonadaceae bacterium]|nr:UPF0149 family protein [Hyphomonadaceae bacterium]